MVSAARPENELGLPTPSEALEIIKNFLAVEDEGATSAPKSLPQVQGLRPHQIRIFMKTREELAAAVSRELKKYSESNVELSHVHNYWRQNASAFPLLRNSIRCFLSGSATTGNIERLFRDAANINTDYRSSLKPETVSSLLLARTKIKRPVLRDIASE